MKSPITLLQNYYILSNSIKVPDVIKAFENSGEFEILSWSKKKAWRTLSLVMEFSLVEMQGLLEEETETVTEQGLEAGEDDERDQLQGPEADQRYQILRDLAN